MRSPGAAPILRRWWGILWILWEPSRPYLPRAKARFSTMMTARSRRCTSIRVKPCCGRSSHVSGTGWTRRPVSGHRTYWSWDRVPGFVPAVTDPEILRRDEVDLLIPHLPVAPGVPSQENEDDVAVPWFYEASTATKE